jgi:hypothetical protein
MQTVLVIQSAAAGVIYLNGRMLGEVDAEHTITIPVCPTGALILEMHPFGRGLLPLTLRFTLSHGVPILPEEHDGRYAAALWEIGVLEIELIPQKIPDSCAARTLFEHGGIRFSFREGEPPQLLCETRTDEGHTLGYTRGYLPCRIDEDVEAGKTVQVTIYKAENDRLWARLVQE